MKISPVSFTSSFIRSNKAKNNLTNKKENVNFVRYEDENADDVHIKTRYKPSFRHEEGLFAECIYNDFKDNRIALNPNIKFYGIESSEGDILALMETKSNVRMRYNTDLNKPDKNGLELSLMCVSSDNSHDNKKRKYSKLGTILVSNAIKQARIEKRNFVVIENSNDAFWQTIPFFEDIDYGAVKVLYSENFKKCASKLDQTI